jgi:Zn2+/Cd2+-exporting ATPase
MAHGLGLASPRERPAEVRFFGLLLSGTLTSALVVRVWWDRGTICQSGSLDVRTTALADDSAVSQIRRIVGEVALSQTPTQEALDRFAKVYTPLVLIAAAAPALAPPLLLGRAWRPWLDRGLSVLVLACPCAIVMAAPLPALLAVAESGGAGVVFKTGAALEALGLVGVVATDKTGTLTEGNFRVKESLRLGRLDEALVRLMAAALESRSSHPVAAAIINVRSYAKGGHWRGLGRLTS